MTVLLVLLSLAMIVSGAASVYSGSLIISVERGWTMVIAGSVVASSGALGLGLAVIAQRLKDLRRENVRLRQRFAGLEEVLTEAAFPSAAEAPFAEDAVRPEPVQPVSVMVPMREEESVELAETAMVVEPEPVEPEVPAVSIATVSESEPDEAPENKIVGSYDSGGTSYKMYGDGSIRADTPDGEFRFASLDELKAFAAAPERKEADGPAATDPPPRA